MNLPRTLSVLACAATWFLVVTMVSSAFASGPTPKPNRIATGAQCSKTGDYKFYDGSKGDGTGSVYTGCVLAVDRIGFALRSQSAAKPLGAFTIDGANISLRAPTKGGDLPAGVVISSGVGPITIRNSVFSGFKMVPSSSYGQGDGVDCDSRSTVLILDNNISRDNGDGGFDTKCTTMLGNLLAENNHRNFRLWGRFTVVAPLTSINPRNAHVWLSQGASGDVIGLRASGSTGKPVFYSDKKGLHPVRASGCVFDFTKPTKVLGGAKNPNLTLEDTCIPDAKGYAVNTAPDITGLCTFAQALNDNNDDGKIVLGAANAKTCGGKAGLTVTLKGQNRAGQFVYGEAQ